MSQPQSIYNEYLLPKDTKVAAHSLLTGKVQHWKIKKKKKLSKKYH